MTVAELILKIGTQVVGGDSLGNFIKTLESASLATLAEVAGIEELSRRLVALANDVMQAANAFEMFESTTGLSALDLQRWQGVARQANVSAETVSNTIQTLGQRLAQIRLTGEGIKPFQIMGIAPGSDPLAVLAQMRAWARGQKDTFFAGNMLEEAGVSRQFLQIFRLSDKEFQNFVQHSAIMTTQQENSFNRWTLAIKQMHEAFTKMGYSLIEIIAPAATHSLNIFNAFLDIIIRFKGEIAAFGVAAAVGFLALNPAIAGLVAAFGLLFVVLDDFAVYFEGGDSIIGRAIKGLERMPRVLAPLKAVFELMKDILVGMVSPILLLQNLFEKAESIMRLHMTSTAAGGFSPAVAGALSNVNNQRSIQQENNFHISSSGGALDAPGYGDVAYFIKKAVNDANIQLVK